MTLLLEWLVKTEQLPFARLLVARKGRRVYDRSVASEQSGVQLGDISLDSTLWQIDSVTKVFTSFAAAICVHELRLFSWDDSVGKHLPDAHKLKLDGHRLPTLQECATHTAGLPYDSKFGLGISIKPPFATPSVACDALGRMSLRLQGRLAHPPGVRFQYGWGHKVIAQVIERHTNSSLLAFLQTYLLAPAGLPSSDLQAAPVSNRSIPLCVGLGKQKMAGMKSGDARGYRCQRQRSVPHNLCVGGDGGLHATARALLALAQTLDAGGVLPNGVRVLSAHATDHMIGVNHLPGDKFFPARVLQGNLLDGTTDNGSVVGFDSNGSLGFGLGGYLTTDQTVRLFDTDFIRPRQYGWVGMNGVLFHVDLVERVQVLFFTQLHQSFFRPELAMPGLYTMRKPALLLEYVYRNLLRPRVQVGAASAT
eukprot:CAMPEP_0119315628 /NCGR_PEP_ID=MMETSP1333-20130426/36604_1 /TAXON_ID=418940 /ORGANISM="Scyphosphaera apsteinii, Strain RCC1455" /LENGTH=421 /DNA_ID=CAMNT_0007321053 /DNA_START=138 /DNA_END=1403 /DNA_ORIENTATION=-